MTQKSGEAMDLTCVIERHSCGRGWILWGSSARKDEKGPFFFWENDWVTFKHESYYELAVAVIDGWVPLTLAWY
jgi:hypothetical protein